MSKLVELSVYIYGLRGVGFEIAKNTILAGPKKVHVHDNRQCELRDLNSNFYITSDDVTSKSTRQSACIGKLKVLNPYVDVDVNNYNINDDNVEFLKEFNVVIITDVLKSEQLFKINE